MAEDEKGKGHGNLDFSAPLLSTRRPALVYPHLSSSEDSNASNPRGVLVCDISKRVPFSWETAPGMPKDKHVADDLPPPPKLPPARWRPTDSSDADNDDDDVYFSDAMDTFAFPESMDVEDEDTSRFDHLEMIEDDDPLPGCFILRRVLPVASSSSNLPVISSLRNTNRRIRFSKGLNVNQCDHPSSIAESYSTPKACGLTLFFPWRTRALFGGVKSPVRRGSRQSQT